MLPEDLEKAEAAVRAGQGHARGLSALLRRYPFATDGYKLIEVPYSGMEHQSAVTYGNLFKNGYLGRDWTGVGISPRFDFIIIHESGHEWFGNASRAADRSDMWIHEGWTTYLECLYVEYRWGKDDALKYLNGYQAEGPQPAPDRCRARRQCRADGGPVLQRRAVAQHAAQRHRRRREVVGAAARTCSSSFKYQNILTEDVVALLQPAHRHEPDADLRPIPATCGNSAT